MKTRISRILLALPLTLVAVAAAYVILVPAQNVDAVDGVECVENGQGGFAGPSSATDVDCLWSDMDADQINFGIAHAACSPAKVCDTGLVNAGTCTGSGSVWTTVGRRHQYTCGNFGP